MSVTVKYSGNTQVFQQAVKQANTIMHSDAFFSLIASRTIPFAESRPSNLSPLKIAEVFKSSQLVLTLREYRRHSSIGGAFDPDYPKDIYGNVNAVDRGVCAMAAVFIHECVHALSFHTADYDFSHDNDNPGDNQQTAPYWIQRQVRNTYCSPLRGMDSDELLTVELTIGSDNSVKEPGR